MKSVDIAETANGVGKPDTGYFVHKLDFWSSPDLLFKAASDAEKEILDALKRKTV
jgi:hypothetical protein